MEAIVAYPPKNANEEPRKAGTLNLVEKQCADTGADQGDLNMQDILPKITVYQDRDKNCCAEHGKHVLQTEQQHLWNAKN
jgi:hypothetical protein